MAKDDPHRIVQIEIEDAHAPTIDTETSQFGNSSDRPWAALAIITLLLGAFVVVLWASSTPEASADRSEPVAPLEPPSADRSVDEDNAASNDAAVSTDEIPELNPVRLDVRLAQVVSFDGVLIGLTTGGEQREPPILLSQDGVEWEEVDTQVDGPGSATEYFWKDLQVIDDELVIVGIDFDTATDYFASTDGVTWEPHGDEAPPSDPAIEFDGISFSLINAENSDRRTWALPQELLGDGSQDPDLVGKVSVRFLNRYLFEGNKGLWVLDPNTDTWEQISTGVAGHRNLMASPSGQRLVSVNNGELTVIHVTEGGSRLGLRSCTYALSGVAPEQQLAGTSALVTTEGQVIFASPTGTWRVEIPTPDSTCDRWVEAGRPTAFTEITATPLAHSDVVLFEGMFVSLDSRLTPTSAPPLLQSVDGIDWSPIDTKVTVDGEQSAGLYSWRQLEVAGAGLSVVGSGDAFQRMPFLSTGGSEWVSATGEVQPSVDPFRSFVPLSVTEESIIGEMAVERGPDDLNIGDDVDLDLVRVCLRDLGASFFTPDRMLVEFDRERRELDQVALADTVVLDQTTLGDGRVVGVARYSPVSFPVSCQDVVEFRDAVSEFLYVMDPTDSSFIEWPLHPPLVGADDLRLIGEVLTESLRLFVLTTSDGLWTFDPRSQEWRSLGPEPAGQASTMLSSSGQYLYSLDGDLLQRWLFAQVDADISVEVCVWVLPQEEPRQTSIGQRDIVFASDDHVGYQTPSASWLIDIESLPRLRELCTRRLGQPAEGNES